MKAGMILRSRKRQPNNINLLKAHCHTLWLERRPHSTDNKEIVEVSDKNVGAIIEHVRSTTINTQIIHTSTSADEHFQNYTIGLRLVTRRKRKRQYLK